MAHQPPSSTPIPRPPSNQPGGSNHHPVNIRSALPIPLRLSPPALSSNSRNRSHAPWPLHNRQIPHWPSISLQGPPHSFLSNRRRPRAGPKRSAQRNGLARYPRHISEDEELHPHQVCFLLAVCFLSHFLVLSFPLVCVEASNINPPDFSAKSSFSTAYPTHRMRNSETLCRQGGSGGTRKCFSSWRTVRRIALLLLRIWSFCGCCDFLSRFVW